MQNAYQMRSPIIQRGRQSSGLAPQASMIDPNLTNQQFAMSQMQAFAQNRNQAGNGMELESSDNAHSSHSSRTLPSTDVTDETLDDGRRYRIFHCHFCYCSAMGNVLRVLRLVSGEGPE